MPTGPIAPPTNRLRPGGPDRPSPLGLAVAAVGLLLLAVGSLIPQVSFGGSDAYEASGFGLETAGMGLPGLAPAMLLLVLVGWAAAGVRPGLQWTVKLGGIGLAAITAAAALHPVIELNAALDREIRDEIDISASAGGGIWLAILAAVLLTVSIFLMRWTPQPQPVAPQQVPQPPAPPGRQGPPAPQPDCGWPGYTQQ